MGRIGSGRVKIAVGWVGLSQAKWIHGQLCQIPCQIHMLGLIAYRPNNNGPCCYKNKLKKNIYCFIGVNHAIKLIYKLNNFGILFVLRTSYQCSPLGQCIWSASITKKRSSLPLSCCSLYLSPTQTVSYCIPTIVGNRPKCPNR